MAGALAAPKHLPCMSQSRGWAQRSEPDSGAPQLLDTSCKEIKAPTRCVHYSVVQLMPLMLCSLFCTHPQDRELQGF